MNKLPRIENFSVSTSTLPFQIIKLHLFEYSSVWDANKWFIITYRIYVCNLFHGNLAKLLSTYLASGVFGMGEGKMGFHSF